MWFFFRRTRRLEEDSTAADRQNSHSVMLWGRIVCAFQSLGLITQGAEVILVVTEEVAMGTQAPPSLCHVLWRLIECLFPCRVP